MPSSTARLVWIPNGVMGPLAAGFSTGVTEGVIIVWADAAWAPTVSAATNPVEDGEGSPEALHRGGF